MNRMSASAPLASIRDLADDRLGRVSMYRLVTIALSALVLVSVGYAVFGGLGKGLFTPTGQLVTLLVLGLTVTGTSWVIGRVMGVRAHLESSMITALLLYFLFLPQSSGSGLAWIAVAGVSAGASKYLLAWRGRHIFNPAAAGAFLAYVIQRALGVDIYFGASWWVASADLLPWVVLAVAAVVVRTRRIALAMTFTVVAAALLTFGLSSFGQAIPDAVATVFRTTAVVFFAGFMLTEPLTLPPRRWQQCLVALVMAIAFAYPSVAFVFSDAPPMFGVGDQWQVAALLIGNATAFVFGRQQSAWLTFVEARDHGSEVRELVFEPSRPVKFEAGQYAELHVPHRRPDRRGTRRVFSIASPPGAETVTFALRVPQPGSSLKQTLGELSPGVRVRMTAVSGDFVLPTDLATPVLLVAGGIGVTPFLSQLRAEPHRNAIVVFGLADGRIVPFADDLAQCRVVVVSSQQPADLPDDWTWLAADHVSASIVAEAVADLADRTTYLSGPPAMVNAVRPGLRGRTKSLHTDYFSGY